MAEMLFWEALRRAQDEEMANDPLVLVMGEDVGKFGGVFRATLGLQEKFGADRVIFATNWGVSAHFGTVDNVKKIIMEFLEPKGQGVMNKAMYRNAIRVYNIRRRYLR